jgi:hypothetical protein
MKTSSNVDYKESVHIQDVAIKLTRVLKIMSLVLFVAPIAALLDISERQQLEFYENHRV